MLLKKFLSTIENRFPPALHLFLRRLYFFPIDLIEKIQGRDGLTPPRSLIFRIGDKGGEAFKKSGEAFLTHFTDFGQLQSKDRVLDVGCGIGRMAVALTRYLSSRGEYWGFDIVPSGIYWCQKHIEPQFPNFHFVHADIYNQLYNPKGKESASTFRFPFLDDHFDFIFATSVFTHMRFAEVERYFSEVSRVLRPGGRCLLTFFLLNEESSELIRQEKSELDFHLEVGGDLTIDAQRPERAIAQQELVIRQLLPKNKLQIQEPIQWGRWCGRETFTSFQDMILAIKDGS